MASHCGLQGSAFPTVKAAYHAALTAATPADFIFVGGSSYVVADFLS
jgi:dihydrofolate synthase/folylpolyglutamate synthase